MADILIVDDEAPIRSLLGRALIEAGMAIDVACDGQEAVDKARETAYRVVVMDIVMPGMGGIDALLQIRNLLPQVEAIIVTGKAPVKAEAFQNLVETLVVRRVFEKPIDIAEFVEEVRFACED